MHYTHFCEIIHYITVYKYVVVLGGDLTDYLLLKAQWDDIHQVCSTKVQR
jgi:hypothetical protein